MHDGYAGDHKDYYKLTLLKTLSEKAKFKAAICWMLTPTLGSGNDDIGYLKDRSKWVRSSEYAEIFNTLNECVNGNPPNRTVAAIREKDLIPNATYFSNNWEPFEKSKSQEGCSNKDSEMPWQHYWRGFDQHLQKVESDLIFFDPNTGVQSIPTENHLDFDAIGRYYKQGKSILFIQFHTDRSKTIEEFIPSLGIETIVALSQEKTEFEPELLWCFWCKTLTGNANVLFYLALQPNHQNRMTPVIAHLKGIWKDCTIKRSNSGIQKSKQAAKNRIQSSFKMISGSEMFLKKG
jgi:hypothetical protein